MKSEKTYAVCVGDSTFAIGQTERVAVTYNKVIGARPPTACMRVTAYPHMRTASTRSPRRVTMRRRGCRHTTSECERLVAPKAERLLVACVSELIDVPLDADCVMDSALKTGQVRIT